MRVPQQGSSTVKLVANSHELKLTTSGDLQVNRALKFSPKNPWPLPQPSIATIVTHIGNLGCFMNQNSDEFS